ncbi:MAG: SpoIVB peptidase [Firmicutes bacterium]|nr:SpoIVB peptidase [Bacillota bacterium]
MLVFALIAGYYAILPGVRAVQSLPDNLILTKSDLSGVSRAVSYAYDAQEGAGAGKLSFRLFGLFPIKSITARVESKREVILGGMPIGISVKADGVMVTEIAQVASVVGKVRPKTGVEAGDIITELNGKRIVYIDDLNEAMADYGKGEKQAELRVLRGGKEKRVVSYPVIEEFTERYKLGFEVKEYAEGIGTVSYIKPDGEFGSLGHPINSTDGTVLIPCRGGNVYECRIIGCNRGLKGNPGEVRGIFVNPGKAIGQIHTNLRFGVYGKMDKKIDGGAVEIGSRLSVRPGKALMITTVKDAPEAFEIEIIKAMPQSAPGEKGMIIRVTDKRLLGLTGGIVQGMSGSPVLQDGKLVGAVTHVFLNDPTKGYAVYMDWMYV